jgi:hypothetical protein
MDDALSFLDDIGEIPVVGGGAKRTVQGGSFVPASPAPASKPSTAPAPVRTAAPVPAPKKGPAFNLAVQLEQDKKDLDAAKTRRDDRTDAAATKDIHARIDGMLDSAITESGVTLANSDMASRYHAIAKTFFRGLRDALETRSKLTMQMTSGGLGMSDADAGKVMDIFSARLSSFQAALTGEKEQEKQKFVAKEAAKHRDERREGERATQQVLDAAYRKLTGKDREAGVRPSPMPVGKPKAVPVISLDEERPADMPTMAEILSPTVDRSTIPVVETPAPPAPLPPLVASTPLPVAPPPIPGNPLPDPDQPKVAPPPPNLHLVLGEVAEAPAPKPSVVEPVHPSIPKLAPTPPVPSMAPVPAPRPALAVEPRPAPTSTSAPLSMPAAMKPPVVQPPSSTRPVVSDVKPAGTKLMGPIQELESFSLVDFRRLSKEPRERTLKIKDKIDLLDEQSFGAKTEGIKAWQNSPTNRLYLDMLRASLEGKPVPDVITEREAGGKDVLSKEEFDAIMDLNRTLRFG